MPEVALVTGGAQRLGAAITRRLAASGHAVAIHCHRSRAEAEALRAEIVAGGGRAAVVQADLADTQAVTGLMDAARDALGPVSVLVNNAALYEADDVRALDVALWQRQFAVNLLAPSLLAGAFANALPAEREGVIVNLIDQRVWKLHPRHYSYTLTKSALWTATRTLAQALAPHIRVVAVGPGPTLPNPAEGEEGFAREVAGTILGRSVTPEAIAEAVHWLIGARGVTGQMIAVDAGQHLAWQTPDMV